MNVPSSPLIDPQTIGYVFDEEHTNYEEPPGPSGHPTHPVAKICAAFAAVGALVLTVQLAAPDLAGSWVGFLAGFGLIVAGTSGYFWFCYKDTVPGIKHDRIMFSSTMHQGIIGWALGLFLTGFYMLLYWYPEYLERAIRLVDPLALALAGQPADQWFFYGFLYTLAIVTFGVRMFMKYRHSRYHTIRTSSVMFFQLGLAFLLPQFLRKIGEPEFYFSYFWPLKYDYLFPGTVSYLLDTPGTLGSFMVGWGAAATFVITPVLTYFFGKRWYCSWVCGCGGLAETLGDPWRHLTPKSTASWRIERAIIYTVLVVITATTVVLWLNTYETSAWLDKIAEPMREWYGFYIGALFSGVIGVGFYPVLGTRVWCRLGCPMAAILGILQRFFSRFRITTNGGQCMSCGNCTTYCEMGIDVRAYAERGENIVRASCVGCGVCAAVCPRGVLKLESGKTHKDRYPGSDRPLGALRTALKGVGICGDKDGYV
ncbi:MAG: 4Fe-4S binding protein [candidate division Zixibacteria bacterium]|nr:4Fe-4S binding protein [candidate division Zixibacteria bacterium]